MNPWLPAVFVALLLFVVWAMSTIKSRHYKAKQELARQITLFSRESFISFDGIGAIAMDKTSRKILLADTAEDARKILSFNDLLSVELLEDGTTITKTCASGARHLNRNTVETLVAGAVPAGDCGQFKGIQTDVVHRIELRMVIADVGAPYRVLVFWNAEGRGLSRKSGQYARVRGQADRWCAKLQVIIKQADDAESHPRQSEWNASVLR